MLTLARQMYPGRSQRFMDAYEKAVGRPYGYLLVDLKPTTSSDRRLVPNGLTEADQKALRPVQALGAVVIRECTSLCVHTCLYPDLFYDLLWFNKYLKKTITHLVSFFDYSALKL